MPGRLVVYGAYGYTGELVARHAVERGLAPVLAGRDPRRLGRLAATLGGCEVRPFALDDPAAVRRGLEGATAVLHCAGPFAHTFRPVAEACVAAGVHYLDVTGELPVFEALAAMGPAAERAGVMLLPGTGFDVVPSDCLAAHLVRRLPGATSIVLAFAGLGRISRGTARTMLLHAGLRRPRRAGGGHAPRVRTFDLGDGRPSVTVSIPWGDLVTAPRSTGVEDVTVYMKAPLALGAIAAVASRAAPLLQLPAVRSALAALMSRGAAGPSTDERARGRGLFRGEARDGTGARVVSLLRTPDGYALTAATAVEIAWRVLRGEVKPGWQTPATAYGPDLILAIPGVERTDLP